MKRLKNQFRTFCAFYQIWRDRLTGSGKAIAVILVLSLPQAAVLDSSLFLLYFPLLTAILGAWFVSHRWRPILSCRQDSRGMISCNDSFEVLIHLHNDRNLSALDVHFSPVADPRIWGLPKEGRFRSCLAPKEELEFSLSYQGLRRGEHPLPSIRVTSAFPFYLIRQFQTIRAKQNVVVLPAFQPLKSLGILASNDQDPDFLQLALSQSEGGTDYVGSREYLPGMPVRRWDYASWSRLQRPVIREYRETTRRGVTFIIDTYTADFDANTNAGGYEPFESMLSLAAAFVDSCRTGELPLEGMFVGHQSVDERGGNRQTPYSLAMRALATAQPQNRDWTLEDDVAPRQESGNFIVCMTNRSDAELGDLRRSIESRLLSSRRHVNWQFVLIESDSDGGRELERTFATKRLRRDSAHATIETEKVRVTHVSCNEIREGNVSL